MNDTDRSKLAPDEVNALAGIIESRGLRILAHERNRQLQHPDQGGLGFDAAQDAGHDSGEMAMAAAAYAAGSTGTAIYLADFNPPDEFSIAAVWPWDIDDDHRTRDDMGFIQLPPTVKARIRLLAKAGALVAAEIDRLLEEEDGA